MYDKKRTYYQKQKKKGLEKHEKILTKIIKKYWFAIFLQVIFIALNMYFLTYPPKIIGHIVDLLYDMQNNRSAIYLQVWYLLGICFVILAVRMPWRWLTGYTPRSIERDLKDKLFEQFMKIKMTSLQNIKNGELMSYFVKDVSEIRAFIYRLLSYGTRFVFTAIIATYTILRFTPRSFQ